MIIEILQFLIGSFVALFLTGFLITGIFFREFKGLEKIAFSIAFSIIADVAIAIFLGYDEAQAARTGGLNFMNIAKVEAIAIAVLFCTWIFVNRKNFKKKPKLDENEQKETAEEIEAK